MCQVDELDSIQIEFRTPFTLMIAGPTKCGKTTFVDKLLTNADSYFSEKPNKIFYFYNSEKPSNDNLNSICHEFIEGLPDMEWLTKMYEKHGKNNVIVIDDQALNITKDVAELFSVGSSRRHCSVIFLTQNLFGKKKEARDISLNCSYVCMFKNPRDVLAAQCFFRQFEPRKSSELLDIYRDATQDPHSYLLIDLHQNTANENRLLSNIFCEGDKAPVLYRY